jgi:hypothetical protein
MKACAVLLVVLFPISASLAQFPAARTPNDRLDEQRLSLLNDAKVLAAEALNLDKPLARALALAETAEVAWPLDFPWAKTLLIQAYELTFPSEEVQSKSRNRPVGAPPVPPTSDDRATSSVRQRILQIASRDRRLAAELVQLEAKQLGDYQKHERYADLADQAAANGNRDDAKAYVIDALRSDPTQINTLHAINEIAKTDRATADAIILSYLELLRSFPLSRQDESDLRAMFMLLNLVFPQRFSHEVPLPGPAVMRGYVQYVIALVSMQDAAGMQRLRPWLLSIWSTLQQYAPELTSAFNQLESQSKRSGETWSPPQKNVEEKYESDVNKALDSDRPDQTVVMKAINREDFHRARKLIEKLEDGPKKSALMELLNTREALSLTKKGDTEGARVLASQLNRATSILLVYPSILEKCIAKSDQTGASGAVQDAMTRLKRADTTPEVPPAGIPASAIPTGVELDPIVLSLSKLAKLILPINSDLGFMVLAEMVAAANRTEVDSGNGRPGFETDVFKFFAAQDPDQAELTAYTLKDRLRRIVSLAAVYKSRVERLTTASKKAVNNSSHN